MRRHAFVAAASLLPTVFLVAYGCSDNEEPDDLCAWLGNPENCYRKFAEDIGDRCGAAGLGNAPQGSFLARDALDVCVLSAGGQVLFDPALDLTALPGTDGAELVTFSIINADGTECGGGSYGTEYYFSVNVVPDEVPDGGSTEGLVTGGTFSSTTEVGRDTIQTSCPTGENHLFSQLQVDNCPQYAALLPRAEVEVSPGGIDPIEGYIRFRVYYPPTDGALEDAQPTVVEYFECKIPPAPEPCVNGVQDGSETDVDCGGNEELCPTRCEDGQKCLEDSDCEAGFTCDFDLGLKYCMEGAGTGGAGTGGSGGAATGGGGAGGGGAGGG